MATFTPQSDSDEAGVLLFQEFGRGAWTTRDRRPDVHIDFEIELRTQNEPTGLTAYVQLKSSLNHRRKGDCLVVSMKKKHLRYYSELSRQPVFLVLADLKSRKCVYLFIQEWIDRTKALDRPGKTKTILVAAPLLNNLEVAPQFAADVRRALSYMREKNPGTPEAALAKLSQEYTVVDNRFGYKISVGDEGRTIQLIPKEVVSLKLEIHGSDSIKYWKEIQDFNAYGKKPNLSGALVALSGSPIFDNVKDLQLGISGESKRGEVLLFELKHSPFAITCSGTFTGGKEGVLFESEMPQSPFVLSARLPFEKLRTQGPFDLFFRYDFKRWSGLSVLRLPFFEALLALALSAEEKTPVRFRFSCEGMPIGEGILNFVNETRSGLVAALSVLNLISEIKEISKWSNLSIRLPESCDIRREDVRIIGLAHTLIQRRLLVARRHPFSVKFTAILNENWDPRILEEGESKDTFQTEIEDFRFVLFGTPIVIPKCRQRYTKVRLLVEIPSKPQNTGEINLILQSSVGGTHQVVVEDDLGSSH